MKTYIVRINDPKVRETLVEKFEKVGTPRAMFKTLLVTTCRPATDIQKVPGVTSVMEDGPIHPAYVQENPPNWALPVTCGKPDTYEYQKTGDDVDIYVIDSGIKSDHVEFKPGQVETIYTYNDTDFEPQSSHGTAAASQAAGITCGIAKNANIKNVKILYSVVSVILQGFDRVLEHHLAKTNDNPSILNMSFGTTDLSYFKEETLDLTEAGVVCVACAHNYGQPQSTAPACHPWVISVGATDQSNNLAYFSNYGPTVDVLAPGSANYVADINGYAYYSGTSFSCPIVAGVLALIAQGKSVKNQTDVERITASLLNYADTSKIVSKPDTTNRLAWSLLPTNGAKIYLDAGETNYTVAGSGTTIYGQAGFESVNICPGVVGVYVDGNVEEIFFHGLKSEYTFKQRGNSLIVYKDGLLVIKTSVQSHGLRIVFGQVYQVTLINGVMKIDGEVI